MQAQEDAKQPNEPAKESASEEVNAPFPVPSSSERLEQEKQKPIPFKKVFEYTGDTRKRALRIAAKCWWQDGRSRAQIEDVLLRENREACKPPLPEDEVRAIAAKVCVQPAASPDEAPKAPDPRIGEPITIGELEQTVNFYYLGLLASLKCGLAVCAAMALKDRTKPLSLVFETTSGYGKTAVVQSLFPLGGEPGMGQYIYRCDKFTPRAFVTHAANKKRRELVRMDLLPQLKNKLLVTKELAPIFRGRDEDLQENFSTLIAVLDGKGFTSNSGAQGKRGYEEDIIFNWIGATTPLPRRTHRLMYQLGTRLLFYEVPSVEPSDEDLLAYAGREDAGQGERECQLAVNRFLYGFFKTHPIGSVEAASIVIPGAMLTELVQWARFLVKARAGLKFEQDGKDWDPIAAHKPEGPWKVINYFKELARGHALIHGRNEVNVDNLEVIAHVAISSIPGHLRSIIRELRQAESVDTRRCMALCSVSDVTARKYLFELSLLGIVTVEKDYPPTNTPEKAFLTKEFQWLCTPNAAQPRY